MLHREHLAGTKHTYPRIILLNFTPMESIPNPSIVFSLPVKIQVPVSEKTWPLGNGTTPKGWAFGSQSQGINSKGT